MNLHRAGWLGQPWFFVAVAVLALNDHVLKAAFPGWVSGKLSDFAGLVVVATLASVLVGPGWGTVLAGLAFVALKTVPGVAEATAPLLGGGVTLRDPTDLAALAALPVLWLTLTRDRADQRERTRRGWQVIGLVAAGLATTATSSSWVAGVHDVGFVDGAFLAEVHLEDRGGAIWLRSADGGVTWSRTTSAGVKTEPSTPQVGKAGIQCAHDGVCYRVRPGEDQSRARSLPGPVERTVTHGSEWVVEVELGRRVVDLAVNPDDSSRAVLTDGQHAWYRAAPGLWHRLDLMGVAEAPKEQHDLVNSWGSRDVTAWYGVALSLLGWVIAPTWTQRIVSQIVTAAVGLVVFVAGILAYPPERLGLNLTWVGLTTMVLLGCRLAWFWGRRRRCFDPPPGAR